VQFPCLYLLYYKICYHIYSHNSYPSYLRLSTLKQECGIYLHISFSIGQCTVTQRQKSKLSYIITTSYIMQIIWKDSIVKRKGLTNQCIITKCGVHSKREICHTVWKSLQCRDFLCASSRSDNLAVLSIPHYLFSGVCYVYYSKDYNKHNCSRSLCPRTIIQYLIWRHSFESLMFLRHNMMFILLITKINIGIKYNMLHIQEAKQYWFN
jgi:hypothetical protein